MAEKTDLTDNLAYGVDLKNRRIYFGVNIDTVGEEEDPSDFSMASVELAVRAMHRMATESPGKPIELHMNSFGGLIYPMFRLLDEILACPCQIRFIGGGTVMSSASWILCACDERWLHPNTTVMVHDGNDSIEGRHSDVQIEAAESKRLQDILYDIYAANSRMPRAFWEEICQRDCYLTAAEAITLGLADKIIEPKKRGNLRKMRQAGLKKQPDQGEMERLISTIYSRTNKVGVPSIQLNAVVKEPVDASLFVDTSPSEAVSVEEPPKT